jgi:hypothetical protein
MPLVLNGTTGVQDNSGAFVAGTAVASTSGTSIDFTSIPSWVKRITVVLGSVSTNGTSAMQIQLGDSGGIENTGYGSTAAYVGTGATNGNTSSTGFLLTVDQSTSNNFGGNIVLCLLSNNTWSSSGMFTYNSVSPSNFVGVSAGNKTLSATLDRIRITTVGGTDTFDNGSINILYE